MVGPRNKVSIFAPFKGRAGSWECGFGGTYGYAGPLAVLYLDMGPDPRQCRAMVATGQARMA